MVKGIFEFARGNSHGIFIEDCNRLSELGFHISKIQPNFKDNSNCANYELLFIKREKIE